MVSDQSMKPTKIRWLELTVNLFQKPVTNWNLINLDPNITLKRIVSEYCIYLSIVAPILEFLKQLFGWQFVFYRIINFSAIIGTLVFSMAAIGVLTIIVASCARFFGGESKLLPALKLASFASSPFYVGQVLSIITGVNWFGLIGLYSLYLIFRGLPVMMNTGRDKVLPATASVAGLWIFAALVVSTATAPQMDANSPATAATTTPKTAIPSGQTGPRSTLFGFQTEEEYMAQQRRSEEDRRWREEQNHRQNCYAYESRATSSDSSEAASGSFGAALEGC